MMATEYPVVIAGSRAWICNGEAPEGVEIWAALQEDVIAANGVMAVACVESTRSQGTACAWVSRTVTVGRTDPASLEVWQAIRADAHEAGEIVPPTPIREKNYWVTLGRYRTILPKGVFL